MKPVHTSVMNGHPVRFFRCPIAGKEDLPWHAVDDLQRALGAPRSLRQHLQRQIKAAYGDDVRTIVSEGKPTIIAPHWFGQGLVGAHDSAARGVEEDGPMFTAYCRAAAEANHEQDRLDGLTMEESVSKVIRAVARGEAGHVH